MIFDQALIQGVCSLAVLNQTADEVTLRSALALVPLSGFIIRVDAPTEVLKSRLQWRLQHQSLMQRLLEAGTKTNLAAVSVVDRVAKVLVARGTTIVSVNSTDPEACSSALEGITEQIRTEYHRGLDEGAFAERDGTAMDKRDIYVSPSDVQLQATPKLGRVRSSSGGPALPDESYRTSHAAQGYAQLYEKTFAEGYHALEWREVEKPLLRSLLGGFAREGVNRVLDFACGTGRILHLHGEFFSDVVGIDISAEMLSVARQRCPGTLIIEADLTATGPLPEVQGVELCTAFRFFLNAEPSLRAVTLQVLRECLVENGVLVANFHGNPRSPTGRLYQARNWLLGRTINNTLSFEEAGALLKERGFEIEAVHWYGFWPRAGWRLNWLNKLLLARMEGLARRFPALHCYAQTFLIVARRR